MIRVADVLSATIVSAANLIVLFTNTAGANEKIDAGAICTKKEKNFCSSLLYPPLRLFLLCLVCKGSPIFGIWFGRGRAKMSHRQRLHTQPNKAAIHLALFLTLLLKRVEVV